MSIKLIRFVFCKTKHVCSKFKRLNVWTDMFCFVKSSSMKCVCLSKEPGHRAKKKMPTSTSDHFLPHTIASFIHLPMLPLLCFICDSSSSTHDCPSTICSLRLHSALCVAAQQALNIVLCSLPFSPFFLPHIIFSLNPHPPQLSLRPPNFSLPTLFFPNRSAFFTPPLHTTFRAV